MGYGSAIYGTGKYGDAGATFTSRYQWLLLIDWGGTQTDESARLLGVNVDRGIDKYTNGSGDGLQDIGPGRLSLVLDNYDRRYDPRNSSSPLYPNVTNLTGIRLLVNDTSTWDQYPVFAGTIDDIRPGGGTDKIVTVTATDDIELLRQQTATTSLQFDTTAGAAIQAIAEAAGISSGSYQASAHPLTVFAVENVNALQVMTDIAEASLGQLFVDRRGTLTYYDLSYTGMASHNLDEDNTDKAITQTQPWDERYPSVGVYANRWARTATKVLWNGSARIPSGSSVTVKAEWSNIASVGQLVYSRIPYVSAPGVITNALTASLSNITARSATITISNVSPWSQFTRLKILGSEYVTGIVISRRRYQPGSIIRGGGQGEVSTKELFTAENTTLPSKRRAKFVLDNEYCQDGNFASAYATLLKDHLKDGLSTVTVTFSSAASMAQQFGMELYDKVVFTAGTLGINATYYLGAIRHEWQSPGVGDIKTTLTLVQLLKSAAAITPETPLGVPPEIDDETDNDGEGNPVLPPPTSGGCPETAPANGPFAISFPDALSVYGSQRFTTGAFPCVTRPSTWDYPTRFTFNITQTPGAAGLASLTPTVYGYSSAGITNITTNLTGAGSSWAGTFSTFTVTQAIAGIAIELTGTAQTADFTSDLQGWTPFYGATPVPGSTTWTGAAGRTAPGAVSAVTAGPNPAGRQAGVQFAGSWTIAAGDYITGWLYCATAAGTNTGFIHAVLGNGVTFNVNANAPVAAAWTQITLDLTAYAGQAIDGLWVYGQSTVVGQWYIDDITAVIGGQLLNGPQINITDFLIYNVCPVG